MTGFVQISSKQNYCFGDGHSLLNPIFILTTSTKPISVPYCSCKNVNYARRTHCHRCKMERKDARKATAAEKNKLGTEIGKQAADKSRGLFSAEDWQCSQCANVNWSRRQTCNMCNAPKFTDVEERTGKAMDLCLIEGKDLMN